MKRKKVREGEKKKQSGRGGKEGVGKASGTGVWKDGGKKIR